MNNSQYRIFIVALSVCLVCSIAVSVTAVSLRDLQKANQLLDKQRNILSSAGLITKKASKEKVQSLFANIESRWLDLNTAALVPSQSAILNTLNSIDASAVNRHANLSQSIAPKEDIANIRIRENYTQIYLYRQKGKLKSMILPIRGYGLWSTLYGFVALKPDFNTIIGMGFYQHGETPGLGGEVDNPKWKNKWRGKQIYSLAEVKNSDHAVRFSVIKGSAAANHPHHVDGLSGATITSRGVANMMRYWFGSSGYGKFLAKQASTGVSLL